MKVREWKEGDPMPDGFGYGEGTGRFSINIGDEWMELRIRAFPSRRKGYTLFEWEVLVMDPNIGLTIDPMTGETSRGRTHTGYQYVEDPK